MAISPIGVITEFKFEVGAALLGVQSLTGATDKLKNSVDNAVLSSRDMGLAFAANLGFGGGSLLGIAGSAIQASEAFDNVSRSFANIISSNKEHLTGTIETFNDRLRVSGVIIKDIVKDSRKFGLDEQSLLNSTKLLGAALAPKGLAGKNFEVPRELSRNLLKSAPLLGIDPSQTEGQLLRLIGGQASQGDTLFRRLSAESQAFQPFSKKGGTKAFNALDAAKRIEVLRKGLAQFTNDTDVLDDRLNSLNNQMTIFQQTVSGFDGILKPLGDVLKKPIVKAMQFINKELDTTGRALAGNFASIMEDLLVSPRDLIINVLQIRALSKDIKKTGDALGSAGVAGTIAFLANKFLGMPKILVGVAGSVSIFGSIMLKISEGVIDPVIRNMIALGSTILTVTAAVAGGLAAFGKLGLVLGFIGTAFKVVLAPALAVLGVMQIISRAITISRLKDAALLPELAIKVSGAFARIATSGREVLAVFNLFFNDLASAIAPIFSVKDSAGLLVVVLDHLTASMERIKEVVVITAASFNGLANFFAVFSFEVMNGFEVSLLGFTKNIVSIFADVFGNLPSFIAQMATGVDFLNVQLGGAAGGESIGQRLTGGAGGGLFDSLDNITNSFDDGFDEFLTRVLKPGEKGGQAFVNNTTNINGGITIKNEFKEQQEPDRVAFTIKDQLLKAAQNPTSAVGGTFSAGLVGG